MAYNLQIRSLPFREQVKDKIRVLFYLTLLLLLLLSSLFIPSLIERVGIVVGGFLGLFVHWRTTRRCSISLASPITRRDIEDILLRLKHVSVEGSKDVYRPDLSRMLYFDSQIVEIENQPDVISVIGPKLVLSVVIKRLITAEKLSLID